MKSRVLTVALAAMLTAASAPAEDKVETQFTAISHATFAIQTGDVTILVDPVGDPSQYESFSKPDIILITDIHGDHMAPDVVATIRVDNTVVVAPQAVADRMDGVHALANGERKLVGQVEIEAIPMYNLTEGRLKFHEKGRGNGYVITLDKKTRIYISGDTEDIPEMRALKHIDYAFVCMNLPYTMTVEQAASAVLEMRPRVVLPYHYRGTDGLSDVGKFKELVSQDKKIEVRQLDWYE